MEEHKSAKGLEERVAKREHITTDQGNGNSYCSNCEYDLGSDPRVKYEECPKCKYKLVEGSVFINKGGSDF